MLKTGRRSRVVEQTVLDAQTTDAGRTVDARRLYRLAGIAALVAVALVPIQIGVFAAFPYPESPAGWFDLLRDNPTAGLVDLDALLVVDSVLLIPIALAVYVTIRRDDQAIVTVATAGWLLSIVLTIASNPAVEMLSLADRFHSASSDAERAAIMGGAEAVLATWDGTGFQVAYVVGQLAGIALGLVMLRGTAFGRAVPVAMIAGDALGFGYYLPKVGLAISAVSGIVLWGWYLLIGKRFLLLAKEVR
jgi:hypothetical protein